MSGVAGGGASKKASGVVTPAAAARRARVFRRRLRRSRHVSEHSTPAPAAFPSVADARRAVSLFARPILRRTVATLGGALVVGRCGPFEPLLLKNVVDRLAAAALKAAVPLLHAT